MKMLHPNNNNFKTLVTSESDILSDELQKLRNLLVDANNQSLSVKTEILVSFLNRLSVTYNLFNRVLH